MTTPTESKAILATSEFCGPCKILKTQLDQMGAIYESKDLSRDAASYFLENNIKSVPTLICPDGTHLRTSAEILNYFKQHETCKS
jgi:glutaredoxin